ncbi:MAG: DUF1800 domain-containing protein [Gammaproteobacteria bacterium]|nr:DUF1800 domain-containing protein [Gammaproteobacteria bacterium]
MAKKTAIDPVAALRRLQQRRDFLKLCGRGIGYGALATLLPGCGSSSGGDDDESTMTAVPVIPRPDPEWIALKRTSFGPHRDEMVRIRTLGIDAYLEWQLDYQLIDDGTLEADIASLFPLTRLSPADLLAGFPDNIFAVASEMAAATQFRQIFSKRQLFEVMVDFWSDHFNIHLVNGLGPTLKPADDLDVIRSHALGNFRDLLHASAKSPAMLFYLDNFFNQAGAPNENYARELMELHTLGVDGGYSENDVKEVARCFTGWTFRLPGNPGGAYGEFVFEPSIHDDLAKTVLATPIPAGGGQADGETVLDLLASHPSTARFIATKLCRRFIDDDPPAAAVDAVAAAFSASNGDIRDTLRALFARAELLDRYDRKFTRPGEFLAGLSRALAPDTGYPPDNGQFWFFTRSMLGQLPFYWPTPDGYPDSSDYWANTGGLLNRWRLSFLSFAGILPGIDVFNVDYVAMLAGSDTVDDVVDAVTEAVLMRPLSDDHRQLIVDWLVDETGGSPPDTPLPGDAPQAVAALAAAVLISSIYFHLR